MLLSKGDITPLCGVPVSRDSEQTGQFAASKAGSVSSRLSGFYLDENYNYFFQKLL